MVTDSQDSILAAVAGVIAPIFAPMGFGDWRISTALITGFMAKESVVSTLSVLFGTDRRPAWLYYTVSRSQPCWCSACCIRHVWQQLHPLRGNWEANGLSVL